MCYPDDNVRMVQVLQTETANRNHVFNKFCWGNLESLKRENEETLWDDLKGFYDQHYSAERISLVVQVKTKDNCKELRSWIEESFGILENKNNGI